MLMDRSLLVIGIAVVCVPGVRTVCAQENQASLATIKTAKCTFSLLATGTWRGGKPVAVVKPAKLDMEFDSINLDEGTAALSANVGGDASRSDIIVRLAKSTLHFVQMFTDGPIYTTTIFPNTTRAAKMQAVHTRHEFTPGIAVPGFTWQPEQYYGECDVHR
jgi:hypothetical protein